MIKAQYAVVAEHVRPGLGGKFDLLGVFDRIFTSAVPAQHRNLVFVVLLVGENEDDFGTKPFVLRCLRPSGEVLFEQRANVSLKPIKGTWIASNRLTFELSTLPIPEYGEYQFILEVDGEEVASHPLTVAPPPES